MNSNARSLQTLGVSKPVRWTGWQTMPESWDWITDGCTRQQAITRLEAA